MLALMNEYSSHHQLQYRVNNMMPLKHQQLLLTPAPCNKVNKINHLISFPRHGDNKEEGRGVGADQKNK